MPMRVNTVKKATVLAMPEQRLELLIACVTVYTTN